MLFFLDLLGTLSSSSESVIETSSSEEVIESFALVLGFSMCLVPEKNHQCILFYPLILFVLKIQRTASYLILNNPYFCF